MSALPGVVVIGGQTASGKSALALTLAEAFDGEIVCADSRQVYDGMPIASAAPTAAERARVPHHLYGVIDPTGEAMSAGAFIDAADRVIADVVERGRRAIVVGGTGLYLRALRLGLDDAPPADPIVKARLLDALRADGLAALVARLIARDGAAAAAIDLQNPVRVVRALEILEAGGAPGARDISALLARPARTIVDGARWLLVSPAPVDVDVTIRARARHMFNDGLVDEAVALAARLPHAHPLLRTMGIEEALDVAAGRRTVDDAAAAVALRTRQYARRQRTWFKREPWWTVVDSTGAPA